MRDYRVHKCPLCPVMLNLGHRAHKNCSGLVVPDLFVVADVSPPLVAVSDGGVEVEALDLPSLDLICSLSPSMVSSIPPAARVLWARALQWTIDLVIFCNSHK